MKSTEPPPNIRLPADLSSNQFPSMHPELSPHSNRVRLLYVINIVTYILHVVPVLLMAGLPHMVAWPKEVPSLNGHICSLPGCLLII